MYHIISYHIMLCHIISSQNLSFEAYLHFKYDVANAWTAEHGFTNDFGKQGRNHKGVIKYVVPIEHIITTVREMRTRTTPANKATEQTIVYVVTIASRC